MYSIVAHFQIINQIFMFKLHTDIYHCYPNVFTTCDIPCWQYIYVDTVI